MPIAVFDSVTGKIFSDSVGIHTDLIARAAADLRIEYVPMSGRFVAGYLDENGEFITGMTKFSNEQRKAALGEH